jgi:hypothetical protein
LHYVVKIKNDRKPGGDFVARGREPEEESEKWGISLSIVDIAELKPQNMV